MLKGSNVMGNEFVVDEIFEMFMFFSVVLLLSILEVYRERLCGGLDVMDLDVEFVLLSVLIVVGLYMVDDNFDYEFLYVLCS